MKKHHGLVPSLAVLETVTCLAAVCARAKGLPLCHCGNPGADAA